MFYVALYLGCMFVCYFFACRLQQYGQKLGGFVNRITLVSVSAIVFLMGTRMGSNEEIIENLGTIGLQALLFSVVTMTGGVFAVTVTRWILRIDKYGRLKSQEEARKEPEPAGSDDSADSQNGISTVLMTWLIIIFVAAGLLFGYFVIRVYVTDIEGFNEQVSLVMTAGLCILLGSIGLDLGLAGTVGAHIKKAGFRVLVFPAAVIAGTALSSVVMSFLLPSLSVRECLAIGFGFGWYTFAPVAISGAGHVMAGAVSFMHNVIRETSGIILIPVLAKRIGYIEVCSLPGVSAGDIGMTLVEKAARQDIIVYSFAIGMTESVAIPFLVTLAIGA